MKISLTDVDSLLENQSLLHFELIPGKNLQWNTFLNFRGGKLGNIYYTANDIDAVANLNSEDYQLCIPLNTRGDKYRLNGIEASKMFLLTPTTSTSVCFPRKFDELHFVFNAETFAKMAKENEAYELLLDDKVFLYQQYDLKFWSEAVHSFLNDPSTCVDQALKKFMDTFFQVHSISGNSQSPSLMKSFFVKEVFPYLKENIYLDLAVTDMCQKFKVSRRSFENSFRKYFGNSPAAYFKKMKLMKIRHDILNLKDRQISSVLVKFENLHISHFGQYYKRYFGESMSQTLKNR